MDSPTQVLLTFIHAGGAAKTSTTRDVGYELAQRGKKVLLIDLDPQANLTEWLGFEDVQPEQTIIPALERYEPLPSPLETHGMYVIPAHLDLAHTDMLLTALGNPEGRLREALEGVKASGEYDFILLDAPPSLGKLSANGGNAADWVIVPLPASPKGISAMKGVQKMLGEYARTNKELRTALYLMTQYSNTKSGREIAELYEELLPGQTAGPITFRPAVYSRCQLEHLPVQLVDKEAGREISAVVDKLLDVIGKA